MTEFALVLPILAILLFGVLQFGIVFNQYLTLTDAVRAGSRKGITGRHLQNQGLNPEAEVKQSVRNAASDNLKPAKLEIEVESSWLQGSDVEVSATYPYEINLLGVVVKSGRMSSTTKERVE